ncbi:MAG: organomercurial lyase [Chloroflexota bacterium]
MELYESDYRVRTAIYALWLDLGHAPTIADLATVLDLTESQTTDALERLDSAHHIFLDPTTRNLRMANPLSAIETDYRVKVDDHWLYANCAWDTLGIPAMTGDATQIEAILPLSDEIIQYEIKSGQLIAPHGLLVHFSLPVRQWYDDLIHT